MNNMRKRSNNNQRRHGGGGHSGGGQRRYSNNSGGGNRGGNNDGQNIARQKHHATQMREKYMNHARDAQNNGDRVDVEYYLQHVDHYNRVLNDIAVIEAERQEKFREQQHANQPQGGENANQGGEQQQQHQGNDQNNQGGSDDQNNGGSGNMEEPITNSGNQPRMTRQPRNNQPRNNDHNGAQAANANNEEIPLPGGVIGAV